MGNSYNSLVRGHLPIVYLLRTSFFNIINNFFFNLELLSYFSRRTSFYQIYIIIDCTKIEFSYVIFKFECE